MYRQHRQRQHCPGRPRRTPQLANPSGADQFLLGAENIPPAARWAVLKAGLNIADDRSPPGTLGCC